jgi:hypothetical protein
MPDDFFTRAPPPTSALPRKPGGSGRLIAGIAALSFLVGGGLVGWLALDGRLKFDDPAPKAAVAAPAKALGAVPSANASASPAALPTLSAPVTVSPLEVRIAQLEAKLAQLELRSGSASGNAARAEGLLIALAARRALERGMPLGTLEDQLRLRFGNAQPNPVRLVIEAARQPVTLDQLVAGLETLDSKLVSAEASENGWDRFTRQVSGLFVVRSDSAESVRPAQQLAQARLLLRTGQVEAAANLVAAQPGSAGAAEWIAQARRFAGVQQALDQLETAAILEPRELQDSSGARVTQTSPVASPAV